MPDIDRKKCDILILSADLGTGHHQVSSAIKKVVSQKQQSLKVGIYNYFEYIYPPINKTIKFGYAQLLRYFSFGYNWF
ncbi:MAG: hypothetical protein GX160_00285 [Clostridiales bacterium]|nr:hypothetical protein [Clostridiales bacterium]